MDAPELKTVLSLRREGCEILSPGQGLDVDVLLQHVLGYTRTQLFLHHHDEVPKAKEQEFWRLIARRGAHEPVAYLTGKKEFFGFDFVVSPAVLIPRPETELLVERAVILAERYLEEGTGPLVLIDVGVGSGAIILSVVKTLVHRQPEIRTKRITAIGIDLSEDALQIARRNETEFQLPLPVQFVQGDLLAPLKALALDELTSPYFLLLSNPPYIGKGESLMPDVGEYEPQLALIGGEVGNELPRRLLKEVDQFFGRNAGAFLMEIGQGQADGLVSETLLRSFSVQRYKDLSEKERVLEFVRKEMCGSTPGECT